MSDNNDKSSWISKLKNKYGIMDDPTKSVVTIKISNKGSIRLNSDIIEEVVEGKTKLNLDKSVLGILRQAPMCQYPIKRSSDSELPDEVIELQQVKGFDYKVVWENPVDRINYGGLPKGLFNLSKRTALASDIHETLKGIPMDASIYVDTPDGLVPIQYLTVVNPQDESVIRRWSLYHPEGVDS